MTEQQFDAIVIGAGVAGLACAATLVLEGKRPLLVCETNEVASTLRSEWVDGNRGLMQHTHRRQPRTAPSKAYCAK